LRCLKGESHDIDRHDAPPLAGRRRLQHAPGQRRRAHLQDDLRYEPFAGFRSLSLGALGGFQSNFAELLAASPVDTPAQVEQVLARIAAYPRRVAQEIARLREGMRLGWVPPRNVLERVQVQLDAELAPAPEAGPFFAPFLQLGSDIPAAEQQALRERARNAIATSVLPPLRELRAFVADTYLPAAPADGALSRYPQGAEVYAAAVRSQTTAIDWMTERTGRERSFVSSEVDRYYSQPAQALGYMIGELKIIELRDRAKQRLGARFDIRRFHGAVLDNGAVPLPVLEQAVDAWVAAETAAPR